MSPMSYEPRVASSIAEDIAENIAEAEFRIVGADTETGYADWMSAWRRCANGDAFSHPDYLLDLTATGESPLAAVFEDRTGSQVLYAFLLRTITHDACGRQVTDAAYDITAPLLYGGPLTALAESVDESEVLTRFWRRFRRWALGEGVVTEFHRENPIAGVSGGYPGVRVEQAPHVVKRLGGQSPAELLADTSKSFRRNVRRAEAAGLTVSLDERGARLEDFLRLHRETMDRNHAHERFYLERQYFHMLHRSFHGSFAYLYAMDRGRPISVELVIFCQDIAYSFLGASDEHGLNTGANSFLSMRAFRYAQSRGISDYVLTGGVTNTEEDSLLRYKLSMAKSGRRTYRTAQQVIDPKRYAQLRQGHAGAAFFPAYRATNPVCTEACGTPTAEVSK